MLVQQLTDEDRKVIYNKARVTLDLGAETHITYGWVWADFKEKPAPKIREKLKAEGFKWAPKKEMWYFAQIARGSRKGGSLDFGSIAEKYGDEKLTPASV